MICRQESKTMDATQVTQIRILLLEAADAIDRANAIVSTLGSDERALVRNRRIGFVFQNFNLLSRTSAVENVELPLMYRRGLSRPERRRQAVALLSQASVDRAALENLRDEKIKLVEQGSRRLTQALADVADVLTPEQKRQLAEHVGRWRRRHG